MFVESAANPYSHDLAGSPYPIPSFLAKIQELGGCCPIQSS